ncbi:MAG: ubiquitin carboxyl-terminal hydrolase family protein [Candidatus Babeliales bacterium]|jgi:ubiquitin C-terminal hydrolase
MNFSIKTFTIIIVIFLALNSFISNAKNRGIFNENRNDCFMNASTQAISHINELRTFYNKFKESAHSPNFENHKPMQVLFNYLNELEKEEPSPISGSKKFRAYWVNNFTTMKNFKTGQHDAQEFISSVFDILNNEFNKYLTEASENITQNPISTFKLQIKKTITCNHCGYVRSIDEPGYLLPLTILYGPLSDLKHCNDLTCCLKNFFEPTVMNDWTCDNCRQKNARRLKTISFLPKYLVIQLKRFIYGGIANKLDDAIKFDPIIEIDSDIIDQSIKEKYHNKNFSYKLLTFICHEGGPSGGHYWAYGKDSNNNWYKYDDSTVTSITPTILIDILNQTKEIGTPYVLFYELDEKTLFSHERVHQQLTQLKSSLQELKTRLETLRKKLEILKSKL